jgi:tetratricopeptide (TPR) repeat protein
VSVKTIKIETLAARAGLLAAGLIFLICTTFFVRWYFANAIAANTDLKEVADFAAGWAPGDPQTHYTLAVLSGKVFLAEDSAQSLSEYEKAVALAPYDFRLWLELGRARERVGDASGAELALRKSLELAPNYSEVRWTLGNALLRRGKTTEGFAEIRQAAESDTKYVNPAIVTAWQISGGSLAQVKQNVGDSKQVNFALAVFLARQKRFDEAVEIWNALPGEEKKTTFKETGEQLYKEMLAANKYRDALLVRSQISSAEAEKSALGQIVNGGFEEDVKTKDVGIFEWRIADGTKPQIGFDDAQKHGGNQSLVIIFNSADGKDFRVISQTVPVEAGKNYKLETFYKSDLKTSATLNWQIADAADGRVLATSGAVLPGADWTNLKTEFTAANTEAVTLRLVRESCKLSICPISGKVWFDDFSLSAN